ncbi:wound-induced protein 1-like [Neltuma alba]|uniref:wound-induced protein 1-like n=1 Tax=Neltuma alba TaxID=207710 RepID=UPI0010A46368|nr:wound-induced protein 1-like [Prosopis alba]
MLSVSSTHRHVTTQHIDIVPYSHSLSQELANSQAREEDNDSSRKKLVLTLYDALNSGDSETVVGIVASHLEWWFHGPPSHQFLMRLLTGHPSSSHTFRFLPQSIASFGPTVVVEGCDPSRSISWVHAWTVADGIITQVREYFDTSLTVARFGHSNSSDDSLWESTVSNLVGKSVPGLVLAL